MTRQPGQSLPASYVTENSSTQVRETSRAIFVACLASHGIREAITYQAASRYWPCQSTETALYLALALAGYCFRGPLTMRARRNASVLQ